VEVVCPKCGNKGKVKVIKQKKVQNTYKYVVVDHENTKHTVDKELMVEIIEKLLDENWQLKMRVAELEKENSELRERVTKLQDENEMLKPNAERYREMLEHSIIVRWNNVAELDKLKSMLEERQIYMLRVIPYRLRIKEEYADIR